MGFHVELRPRAAKRTINALVVLALAAGSVLYSIPPLEAAAGWTWAAQESNTAASLNDISCVDSSTCWTVGYGGTILATSDGGATWIPQESGTDQPLLQISCTSSRTCRAVGAETILATDDAGATWTPQFAPPPLNPQPLGLLTGVACLDANRCQVAGSYQVGQSVINRMLRTVDGGENWKATEEPSAGITGQIKRVSSESACRAHIVGNQGKILFTGDGGFTWRSQNSGTLQTLNGVSFVDQLRGWAVGTSGNRVGPVGAGATIVVTQDGGESWLPQLNTGLWNDVAFADGNNGMVAGYQGAISTTVDGGTNWTPLTGPGGARPTGADLRGVAMPNASTAFAVGDGGTLLKLTNSSPGPAPAAPIAPPLACPPEQQSASSNSTSAQVAAFAISDQTASSTNTAPPTTLSLALASVAAPRSPKVAWVNSTSDEGGLGPDDAKANCTATRPDAGAGSCTLLRALELANENAGLAVRFDHQVFKSSPPTEIPIEPATGTGDRGHFSILADGTNVDAEPDCQDAAGGVRQCVARELSTSKLDRIRPRVWIRVRSSISEGPQDPSEGVYDTLLASSPALGRHGVFQLGEDRAPVSGVTLRGLLISGSRTNRGAIEVSGRSNLIQTNVLSANLTGIWVGGSNARPGNFAGNEIFDNYLGPVPELGLGRNSLGVQMTGAGNVLGRPDHGNLIRSGFAVGVLMSTGDAARLLSDKVIHQARANVVSANVIEGPADRPQNGAIWDSGVGNTFGGSGQGEGNQISGWEVGIRSVGLGGKILGNTISGAKAAISLEGSAGELSAGFEARLGGFGPGEANVVSSSSGPAISTLPNSRNQILGNEFSSAGNGQISGNSPAVGDLAAGEGWISGTAGPGELVQVYQQDSAASQLRYVDRVLAAGSGRFFVSQPAIKRGDGLLALATGRDGTTRTFSSPIVAGPSPAPPGNALPAPSNLRAMAGTGTIRLTWALVPGAAGYEIHRYTAADFDPDSVSFRCLPGVASADCSKTIGVSFVDSGLPKGLVYHYKVVAYDENGRRGPPSTEVAAAASATSPDVATFVVNQPGDFSTCSARDDTKCLSIWEALGRARQLPLKEGILRAVITFDRQVFSGLSGIISGCCFDLGKGGIVVDGEDRVTLRNPGKAGARGAVLGLTLGSDGLPVIGDDSSILGMRFAGFGPAVTVSGRRNTIGQAGAGNAFEGNEVGVEVLGDHNVVTGNQFLKQQFRNESAFGSGFGVVVGGAKNRIGGAGPGEANVITEGARGGIKLAYGAAGNEIVGNQIGVAASGSPGPNRGPGVSSDLGAYANVLKGNVIAHNRGPGVEIGPLSPRPLTVTRNAIFQNGALGISVKGTGTGCEETIPSAPVLGKQQAGSVNGAACPGAEIELFESDGDSSGLGQGKKFLASATAGSDGSFSFSGLATQQLTATATVKGATSEFSNNPGFAGRALAGLGLSAEALDPTKARLSWKAVSVPGSTAPTGRYQVRQSASPIDSAGFDAPGTARLCDGDCFEGSVANVGDPVQFVVSDLVPETTYYWAVRAVDAGRVGPIEMVSLRLPDVAPEAIKSLTAKAISSSKVELAFPAPGSNASAPPPVRAYLVRQSEASITNAGDFDRGRALCPDACVLQPARVGDALSLSIGGLRPTTTYFYAVIPQDQAGNKGPMTTVSVTTLRGGESVAAGSKGAVLGKSAGSPPPVLEGLVTASPAPAASPPLVAGPPAEKSKDSLQAGRLRSATTQSGGGMPGWVVAIGMLVLLVLLGGLGARGGRRFQRRRASSAIRL